MYWFSKYKFIMCNKCNILRRWKWKINVNYHERACHLLDKLKEKSIGGPYVMEACVTK